MCYCYCHCYRFTPELTCCLSSSSRSTLSLHPSLYPIYLYFLLQKFNILFIFRCRRNTREKAPKKKINVCEYFFFGRLVERQNNKNNIVQCSFHKSFSMGFLRKTLCAQVSMVWMSLHRPQLLHSFGIHWMCIHFFFGRIQTKVWYNENLIRTFLCGTRINSFYFTWKNKIAFKKKRANQMYLRKEKYIEKKAKFYYPFHAY